ncbi:hypothetical protein HNR60_004532 [Rhodopseudomonas rhenobacensis]|uniref:Uncharacterized protein n=1 Tax=Rhodopseudomonas rhenobacensis TaxID=87461 RepID=A0A7W7Z869_9BRAD|nr:hypothetical protein [Rhodopseudomonas rhenobacensis]MBB5049748.1 hypothetical protein [Rhodopseudomonas rhenobacensis]
MKTARRHHDSRINPQFYWRTRNANYPQGGSQRAQLTTKAITDRKKSRLARSKIERRRVKSCLIQRQGREMFPSAGIFFENKFLRALTAGSGQPMCSSPAAPIVALPTRRCIRSSTRVNIADITRDNAARHWEQA